MTIHFHARLLTFGSTVQFWADRTRLECPLLTWIKFPNNFRIGINSQRGQWVATISTNGNNLGWINSRISSIMEMLFYKIIGCFERFFQIKLFLILLVYWGFILGWIPRKGHILEMYPKQFFSGNLGLENSMVMLVWR